MQRLGSGGCRGRNLPGIRARSHLCAGATAPLLPEGNGEERPPADRQREAAAPAYTPQPSRATRSALFLWDGACAEGGSGRLRGLCLPVQVCEGGMPSPESRAPLSSPAGIKLVLTCGLISFIAAPTFPPCQPAGGRGGSSRRREEQEQSRYWLDWRGQKAAGGMRDRGLPALPAGLGAGI